LEVRVTLGRDDIEAVAKRVVELLEDDGQPGPKRLRRLVDAATAASLLGVSRATVYAKAEELGAIRVGNGKRARLRFDPTKLTTSGSSQPESAPGQTGRRRRRSTRSSSADHGNLLPIRGGRTL
jgi:hypothetical protein